MDHVTDFKYSCAATASMFLYAQGSSVVCCRHNTLAIERTFSRHDYEVQLLAVDNGSEAGAGCSVVSYDAGKTVIVWDLMTGNDISRFACPDHLTVAAWMENGNVAFGSIKGSIVIFDPSTSKYNSLASRQIAITAMAPLPDCMTFAIGYRDGSLLIATVGPDLTILYDLTTRGLSIVNLAWHASSFQRKPDMLAVQMRDGDLRVWSVAKKCSADNLATMIRVLKTAEISANGPYWMAWSKNGRIIEYSNSQTQSWDVRTKYVTHDTIPTLNLIRGIAVYGPEATLFTLGPDNTVQQFDLNSPAMMVANVQHPANLLPPSPPVSEEACGRPATSTITIALYRPSVGSPETPDCYPGSMRLTEVSENTCITTGTSTESSPIGDGAQGNTRDVNSYSMGYSLGTTGVPFMASSRSVTRPYRLPDEVPRSPDDTKVHELFKYTRARLSNIPYKDTTGAKNARLTNNDLRHRMLTTIFGWNKDVKDLIRDEMSRQPQGSASHILLAKWLGNMNPDIMNANFENMTSSDWMLLALSGIGAHTSQQKLGQLYAQRLLKAGDVHAAVTIMIGMGYHNEAIEVYISHKRYMEALIFACLSAPSVWERQAAIIRKWGEWAVKHGQQQLAIRCFACTDHESTGPWISLSAAQLKVQTMMPRISKTLGPTRSPPGVQRTPQHSVTKTSALKLITSFGTPTQKSKFFAGDGGQTPVAAGITLIADSTGSPAIFHGSKSAPTTAFSIYPTNRRFNTPTSARGRGRLPSIAETPSGLINNTIKPVERSGSTYDYES